MTREEDIYKASEEYAKHAQDELKGFMSTAFANGAIWADANSIQNIAWHKFPEDKPNVEGKRNRCFIVALEYKTVDNDVIRLTMPALWSEKYQEHGSSYLPKEKFYWGPDIF